MLWWIGSDEANRFHQQSKCKKVMMEDFTRLYEISHLSSTPKQCCATPSRILSDMVAAISTFSTIFCMYSTSEFQNRSQNITSSMWVLSIAAYIIYVCVNHLSAQHVLCVFGIHLQNKKAYGGSGIPPGIILVNLYRTLPLRTASRCWGSVNSVDVPLFLRKPMYGLYSKLFNVNIDEADNSDLTSYCNLQAFFTRDLKPNVREISSKDLTSPCDGRVLYHGKVDNSKVEQIKGITYSLKSFLGPVSWNSNLDAVSHEVLLRNFLLLLYYLLGSH
ncbi:phosphatidylserine decarboxylase proenzyme 1, mitochondrial-like [Anneissia japonica]|uniref:phosphatidylserine decarboxylase proenzyme 1, mitochondrial-like n=1 Tax=Anneissia japonica TaxID=1529436 RepID=UPI001425845C|nr:phosphatidylserine decarboxylase proenzyme 1, mitochondrial-like [Anneissia japonica]